MIKNIFKQFKKDNKLTKNEEKVLKNTVMAEFEDVFKDEKKKSLTLPIFDVIKNPVFLMGVSAFIIITVAIVLLVGTPGLDSSFNLDKNVDKVDETIVAKPDDITYGVGDDLVVEERPAVKILNQSVEALKAMKADGNVAHISYRETVSGEFASLGDEGFNEEWNDLQSCRFKKVDVDYLSGEEISRWILINDGENTYNIWADGAENVYPNTSSCNFTYDPIASEQKHLSMTIESEFTSEVTETTLNGKDVWKVVGEGLNGEVFIIYHIDRYTFLPVRIEFVGTQTIRDYVVIEYLFMTEEEKAELFTP